MLNISEYISRWIVEFIRVLNDIFFSFVKQLVYFVWYKTFWNILFPNIHTHTMVLERRVQSHVDSNHILKKCITLCIYKLRIQVNSSNSGKGVHTLLHLGVGAITKEAFGSPHLRSANFIFVLWIECSPMVRETWVQSQFASYLRL